MVGGQRLLILGWRKGGWGRKMGREGKAEEPEKRERRGQLEGGLSGEERRGEERGWSGRR